MTNGKTRQTKRLLPVARATAVLLVAAGLTGCGQDGPTRVAVSGTVTIAGQPLQDGFITFVPTERTKGPKASGPVAAGRFEMDRSAGPVVGDMRIEITEKQEFGFALDDVEAFDAQAPPGDLPRNRIPPRFNSESILVRTTTLEGPNEFEFELEWR